MVAIAGVAKQPNACMYALREDAHSYFAQCSLCRVPGIHLLKQLSSLQRPWASPCMHKGRIVHTVWGAMSQLLFPRR